MNNTLHFFNVVVTLIFDVVYRPVSLLGPFWSLAFFAMITSILMLWVFGHVSNQDGIKKIKRRLHGNLIGVRLFQHDLKICLQIQGRLLLDTMIYLKYSARPMLIMTIPILLILTQLNWRYSIGPAKPNQPLLVTASVTRPSLLAEPANITMQADPGVTIETKGIRIPSKREVSWRIRPIREGAHTLRVKIGGRTVEKTLLVGPTCRMLTAVRTGAGPLDLLLNPGEEPIDSETDVKYIKISYPAQKIDIFGREMNWLVVFFVLSIAFGYAIKGKFDIQV